jgi:hypothetical protein
MNRPFIDRGAMHTSIRPWHMAMAGAAAVVAGLVMLGIADRAYVTHVTGVYLDQCGTGDYGASAGPDHTHACYPWGLVWLYGCAGAGALLTALGFAVLCRQTIARLQPASGWELGLRAVVHLLAAPVLAYGAFVLLFRGVVQSVWRSGCWICPTPLPLSAPDPYPVFDLAVLALITAGLISLGIALVILGTGVGRLARRGNGSGR